MPDRKKKHSRGPQKKAQSASPFQQAGLWLKDRHPILKFLLGFLASMAIFYIFYYSSFYKNYLELPFLNAQAGISNLLLQLLGHGTTVMDASISSSEFSVSVKNGCDGLEAIAILVSGILIFPATFRLKIPGLLWGIGILLALNLLRIAGLYLAGLYFSEQVFEILHVQGGFIIFTMISVLLLFIWMAWATKQPRPDSSPG